MSYELAALASKGAAIGVAVLALGAAPLLVQGQVSVLETWGARVVMYLVWSALWILYYYVIQVRLEDLGISTPLSRHPLTFAVLGLSIIASPILVESLAVPSDVKLVLAMAMYAGYLPPLNISVVLVALLTRK
jgi:hypothetical protein